MCYVLGVGESRSPVFSPSSTEPRREAGPAHVNYLLTQAAPRENITQILEGITPIYEYE